MQQLIEKENLIFDVLQEFIDSKLEFIIVRGYAVSAFKHRFSVDADIVIKSEDLDKFELILKRKGFSKTKEKQLHNEYASRFMRYEKDLASVDILIDALASRSTDASFGYDLLLNKSTKRKIIGIEKQVETLVPSKEMLIVMKIHSGRLTDFRDIAAMAKDTNLENIRRFLFIGDLKVVESNLDKLGKIVKEKGFIDSFKGVFMVKKFDVDINQVEKIAKLTKS